MAWLRLEARCGQWGWTGELPPVQFAAWVKLLCAVKTAGTKEGTINAGYFSKRLLNGLRIPRGAWDAMIRQAVAHGAIRCHSDVTLGHVTDRDAQNENQTLEIVAWREYQPDPTARQRQALARSKTACHSDVTSRHVTKRESRRRDVTYTRRHKTEKDKRRKPLRSSKDPLSKTDSLRTSAAKPNGDPPSPPEGGSTETASNGSVPPDAVLIFPTRGKEKTWALTQSKVKEWQDLYPGLNILGHCRKALAWCRASAMNRKTAEGMERFLVRWLNRETNDGNRKEASGQLRLTDHFKGNERVTEAGDGV